MDAAQIEAILRAAPNADYGDVMLNNGTTMTGTWDTSLTDRTVHLTDASGKEWWIGFGDVAAFSPQVRPGVAKPSEA